VALPQSLTALIDVDLPATDHLAAFTHCSCSRKERPGQELHHLPLRLLKNALVTFLMRREECAKQQQLDSSDLGFSQPAATPCPPHALYVRSSAAKHLARVAFDSLGPSTELESNVSLVLQLCGRCGEVSGCSCGWRQQHPIPPQMEQQSIREFIGSTLVRRDQMLSTW
jgi:hypothetical protein